MTEPLRQSLLSACAFAAIFIREANDELHADGSSERRQEASMHLYSALENVEIVEEQAV